MSTTYTYPADVFGREILPLVHQGQFPYFHISEGHGSATVKECPEGFVAVTYRWTFLPTGATNESVIAVRQTRDAETLCKCWNEQSPLWRYEVVT